MKVALISTDNRDIGGRYALKAPLIPTPQEALLQGFAAIPDLEVHFVSCLRQPVESPAMLAANIFYHSLHVPKIGWIRTGFQGCVRAVRKKLREIQPDIVHGQGTERDCAMSAVFSGYPNVLTLHGNMRMIAKLNHERPFSYNWLAARLEGFVLRRTRGVVCITTHTHKAVAGLVPCCWIVPNAVDTAFFEVIPRPDPSVAPAGLCVGTICPLKNQNGLIQALDPLAAKSKFKMLFAGVPDDTAYGREFHELVRNRPWCEYIGFIDREQLKARLAAASFLVLPTLEDNCPMVVLEAMAAGVPVLASGVGGVPDLIVPEKTGLLCDPEHPETFRQGVERLLTNSGWAAELAAAARAEARRRFHPQVVARRHLEIYREVLGRPA